MRAAQCGVDTLLPKKALAALRLCRFDRGEVFCREGDDFASLYFVMEGRYKVTRLTESGRECLLRFFDAFSIIGELELFEGGPARTTVTAVTPVTALRLPLSYLRAELLDDARFLRFLCAYFTYKMVQRDQNLVISLTANVAQRTASYVLSAAQNGHFADNYTHLAEFLGCSHRQLLRALAGLCADGVLAREPGGYRVLDAAALRARSAGVYSGGPFCYPGLSPLRC